MIYLFLILTNIHNKVNSVNRRYQNSLMCDVKIVLFFAEIWCRQISAKIRTGHFPPLLPPLTSLLWHYRSSWVCAAGCSIGCFRSPRLTLALCLTERSRSGFVPQRAGDENGCPLRNVRNFHLVLPGLGGYAPDWSWRNPWGGRIAQFAPKVPSYQSVYSIF